MVPCQHGCHLQVTETLNVPVLRWGWALVIWALYRYLTCRAAGPVRLEASCAAGGSGAAKQVPAHAHGPEHVVHVRKGIASKEAVEEGGATAAALPGRRPRTACSAHRALVKRAC
jgi:hypothetical protein